MEKILKTIFEIIECKCGEKYLTTQGTDNAYHCLKCNERLVDSVPITYVAEDSKLIRFIQDNFEASTDVPKRNF